MTFLLKSEVDSQTQRTKYEQLETKVDTLTKLLLPSASMTPHNNTQHLIIPQLSPYPTNTNTDTQMQTHTHTHSRTDRLIFTMYDNHIPCISAVLTSTFTFKHTQTNTDRLTFTMYDDHIPCISAAFTCTFKHIQTHTNALTDRQTYLRNV